MVWVTLNGGDLSKSCVPLDHGTYHVVIIKPDAVVGGQVEGIIQKVRRLLLSASH